MPPFVPQDVRLSLCGTPLVAPSPEETVLQVRRFSHAGQRLRGRPRCSIVRDGDSGCADNRGMKVTMLLADYAAAYDGKLVVVGGGWSVTGPMPAPFGIALKIEVPWDQANAKHHMRLELVDADGNPVLVPTEGGAEQPLALDGEFETGRPAGLKPGTPLDVVLALNLPPQPIPPGGRYEWRLTIDGESEEDWRLAFTTRPEPTASG
jgi:hypothetical protein